MATLDQQYDYGFRSQVGDAGMALATSGGTHRGVFFSGFMTRPDVVAAALLVVARVARTRYYVPPNTAAALRGRDPVITSGPEALRFESFSGCCGVYVRLDVDESGLDAELVNRGVTNVDVNDGLRQSLAGLLAHDPLHLTVGEDALHVTTLDGAHREEKVPLPSRWIRGLAEVQAVLARMDERMSWDAPGARRFLAALPVSSPTKSQGWVTTAAAGARLASRPSAGAVPLAGAERLRVLSPLAAMATGMHAWASDGGASAWVLDLPAARMTVVISPDKSRGFSGEGGTLHSLANDTVSEDADLVRDRLDFDARIHAAHLGETLGIGAERVKAALALLATSGQLGWDLGHGAYFHRPLPFNHEAMLELNPRLTDAHSLSDAGAVTWIAPTVALVESGSFTYRVTVTADGYSCSCPWYAKHRTDRGPCKHVLAARLASA